MKNTILISALLLTTSGLAHEIKPSTGFASLLHGMPTVGTIKQNALKQGVLFATVGTDANCTYQNRPIQDAIDAGFEHVRIAQGTYTENLNLGDNNMTLEGGYADCSAAESGSLAGGGLTTISGSADPSLSTLTIPSSVDVYDVILKRLSIVGGGSPTRNLGGGILVNDNVSNIHIENLDINGNQALNGAGLVVFLGAPSVVIQDSRIRLNQARRGGGIGCFSDNAVINFYDTGDIGAGIFSNAATEMGGGVHLTNGCQFKMYTGQNPNLVDLRGITFNQADMHGGGVSVMNGSAFKAIGFELVPGLGNDTAPVTIKNNEADSDEDGIGNGGGIYVEGVGSTAELFNVNFQGNSAFNGGAVSAENGAKVITESINLNGACWSPGQCNRFHGNTAREGGGVFYLNQNADLDTEISVFTSQIYDNDSTTAGAVANINGVNAQFSMEGSVVYDNTANVILYNGRGTTAYYSFNTIADNNASFSVIRNFEGNLKLVNSIIHNQDNIDVLSNSLPTSEFIDCLITHENSSFTSNVATQVEDPMFIDRDNGDYHIDAASSPAVDFCDQTNLPQRPNDIDNEARGWDDALTDDEFGPYDLGADETYASDVIFKDDFEG